MRRQCAASAPPVRRLCADHDLGVMIDSVASVGYDGSVAIDYRGKGDLTLGLLRSRIALEGAVLGEAAIAEIPF